jgi:hypothetical protein
MELAPKFPGNPLFHGETSHEDNAESEQQSRGRYAGRSPANTGALQARFTESSLAGREYEKKITRSLQTPKKSKKVSFSEFEPEKEKEKEQKTTKKEEEIEFPWMLFILFVVIIYAVYFFYKYQSSPSSSSSDLV